MQCQRLRPGLDEPRPHVETGPRAVLGAAAHLHRDGDVDRLRHGRHDPAGPVGVVEQRRARPGLRHLPDRAAEIDVHEIGSGGLDHASRLAHHRGIRAEDLDCQRMLVAGHPEVAERPLVPVLDPGAADHLGADEAGPEPASLAAKRLHADSRHRGQDDAGRHLHRADPPGLAEVDVHSL